MEDLFRALIQGSGQQSGEEDAGSDPLSGLLQGILGGGAMEGPTGSSPTGAAGSDLAGMLQGLLGGGAGLGDSSAQSSGTGAGGMGDILGAIMGGGSSAGGSDPFMASIATMLSEKLGLPPQIAQAVVVFVLGKLLGGRAQAGSGSTSAPQPAAQGQVPGTSLDGLLTKMNSGARVRLADIRATGMAEELGAHTGLDRATAEASLQEVLNALGGQVGSAAPARPPRSPRDGGLDSLLDDFPK